MNPIRTLPLLLALLLIGAAIPRPADDPVRVFAQLDGVWTGTFVGYDETGRELYRIAVRQEYETVNATTQKVRLRDTMPDGTVITGEGENVARRRPDGTLQLTCIVRKSSGERIEHAGRLVRGPDGDEQIIWHSRADDRVEIFREHVHRSGDQTVYEINGTGRYNAALMLMTGRYYKQETP